MQPSSPVPLIQAPPRVSRSPEIHRAFRSSGLETPAYVLDAEQFRLNAEILREIQARTGVKILLAQKAFSGPSVYPIFRSALVGTTSSGLHEALLAHESFPGEIHVFSPAFKPREIQRLLEFADHLVFNSLNQWETFRETVAASPRSVSAGLRINPEVSTTSTPLYDPCAAGSRFGIRAEALQNADLTGIDGLHFHVLCEQFHDALETAVAAVEERFGQWLPQMKWLNMGGGHLLTNPRYDLDRLDTLLSGLAKRHPHLTLYLEPGEAVAYECGCLIGTVIDLLENDTQLAILDISATCHMPDVLEMPYRPPLLDAGLPGERPFLYRLGGPTCLTGDVIGDFSFDKPLRIGDQVVFEDQAFYTFVKNTTFNGINLPSLAIYDSGEVRLLKAFGYEDFKARLP